MPKKSSPGQPVGESLDRLHQEFILIKDRICINDVKDPKSLIVAFEKAFETAKLRMSSPK